MKFIMSQETHHASKHYKISRVESLSDCIFAFAMTLLIATIALPEKEIIKNNEELIGNLLEIWPKIIIYFMSFSMLALVWLVQHFCLKLMNHSEVLFTWLNIFLLMFVCFFPLSCSIFGAYHWNILAIIIFWANLFIVGMLQLLNIGYVKKHFAAGSAEEYMVLKNTLIMFKYQIIYSQLLYLIALTFAFFNERISIFIFMFSQIVLIIFSVFNKSFRYLYSNIKSHSNHNG